VKKFLVLAVVLVATASGGVKAYDVDVYRNCLSTVEYGRDGVGQYFRMCVDSVTVVSIWVGDKTNGDAYRVAVSDSATDTVLAQTPVQGVVLDCPRYCGHGVRRVTA
jgi:hypothetical protein